MSKRIIFALIATCLLIMGMTQVVFSGNTVSDIQVEVVIYDDGSAYITQTWNGNFSEGTECYIPIQNLGEMDVSNFLVSDINGPYTRVETWDIKDSFEEKVRKYGILETDEGYELCWGISEYGEKRYAIEYKVEGLVGAYTDYDGFNFQFINSGMGTLPTDVTVEIAMQNGAKLSANDAGIWAFGFDGRIEFQEGIVVAYTESPLKSSVDSVIVMLQINKGLLNPTRLVDQSFETVKEKAFYGSDYNDESWDTNENDSEALDQEPGILEVILGAFIAFAPGVLIFYLFIRKGKPRRKVKHLYKSADYFREAPIAGNIEAIFALSKSFGQIKDEGNLIGAAFLKLINAGCLEPITEKKVGLLGKEKEKISLKLIQPPKFPGTAIKMLYELLVLASDTDQILQERELENYCYKNHASIMAIIDASKQDGVDTLVQIDTYDNSKQSFMGLSERGKALLLNVMGFKKYLLEFSLIGERTISESVIWQDYLMVATLLGIADQVIEQFEKVYPEATRHSTNSRHYYLITKRYSKMSYGAAKLARSGGSGGHSSSGGGGGFSGGGSGGGTR